MRVLYILPAEGFGGAERQGVVHITNLPKTGIEVVAAVGPGRPICAQLARNGVDDYIFCRRFPGKRVDEDGMRAGLARPWIYFSSWAASVLALARLGRERKVDVVFASRAFGWTVASFVGRYLQVPVIWRAGSRPSGSLQTLALRHLAPLIAPDLVVANSEAGRRTYAALLPAPTVIVPNGVDTARFRPRPRRPGRQGARGQDAAPVVGLAARPSPEKGLDQLAQVAARIGEAFPSSRFLIAGEFPWRQHYQRVMAAHGLGERVVFLGHVDDIESFYADCDVVVLSSGRDSIEMSSNAILEAMASGRPVVVTNVGGMAETVEHGVNGFLVPPDDAESFSRHLTLLLGNAALRQRFGEAARKRIVACHSQEQVTACLAKILKRITAHDLGGQRLLGEQRKECVG